MKIKSNYIYLTVILLLVFLIGYMNQCKGKETKPTDNLTTEQKQSVKEIGKIDSTLYRVINRSKQDSINRTNNYNSLLKRYYKAIKQAPDTCKSYIDTIYGDALIIDLTDSIAILRKDTVIKLLTSKIQDYKTITRNDTLRIGQLSDSLKSEFKRGKKVGRKQGVVGTVIAGAVLFVGVKAIP